MLGMVTARGTAKRTWRSERMNAILLHVMKLCSWCNHARTEFSIKCWELGPPTRRGWETWQSKRIPLSRKWTSARRAESKPRV